ncbi:NAD(P)-dependent alcohol dehydrogenase [Helicobacter sp. 16-1353]|uniref:NAD(P)-dependent alcohol dehydrogenase n=1 Tax=Helicobacter sp. 16-1353 TaxID=2004996 RepID=UPI00215B852F|nr:NAD(P)-dependent alcohol dehydrogenase [Helicobacter sp. 16-1353]
MQEVSEGKRITSSGFAAFGPKYELKAHSFTRHPVGDNDILIEILYAGICHSDLHTVLGDHGEAKYPMVPGHEIAGVVTAVGKNVSKFKVGDYAGVGCMVNSCGECEMCKNGEQQFCQNAKTVFTYNSNDVFHGGENTMGGYSNNIVLSEKFAIKVPQNAKIERVAPLLCAGVTTFAPIKYSKVKRGQKVAVAGFGGLGHMAVKYMISLGAEVSVFDTTDDKRKAAQKMGVKRYFNVNKPKDFENLSSEFDFIISTIPYKYDINMYQKMLKLDGEMAIVGLPSHADNPSLDGNTTIWNFRRKIYSSLIGGVEITQEMIDYSIANNIYPDVEVIKATSSEINKAYQRVAKGEVQFRYVIDMKTL